MKVLFINSVIYGSTGRICLDLQNKIDSMGHNSIICYGRGKKTNTNNAFRFSNNLSIFFDIFKSRLFDNQGLNSVHKTNKLINFIREYNPDIIHIHNIHGYYVNYKMLFDYFKKEFHGAIVWTLHDCWPFTGHCSYFEYENCQKWKTGCFKCQQKHLYPSSFLIDNSKSNYLAKKNYFSNVPNLHIVVPSFWLKEKVGMSFLSNYPCTVINNGVDTSSFSSFPNEKRRFLLFVSLQWTERKGAKLISEIIKYIDQKLDIIIIGKWKIKKPNIKSIVFIEKRLSKAELNSYYKNAICLVNPTLEDNFPTVNIEAQCCGTPVIAFDSGGTKETIFTNHSRIVTRGDCFQMANEINNLIKEKVANDISEKTSYFDSKRMADDYFKLYLEVLKND